MKAMILAAGRGERLRPLTDTTPKPLLAVGGKPLIVWHLERLAADGFSDIVVNCAHLGEKIKAALGNGRRFGLHIQYSPEPVGALETAGGIANALPLLGDAPFLVVNGDIWCDWSLNQARATAIALGSDYLAHLILVENPPHHEKGDFSLDRGLVRKAGQSPTQNLTYAGIGVFSPRLFAQIPRGSVMKLRPLLDAAIAQNAILGEYHAGRWVDVGTPDRLASLDQQLSTISETP